MERIAIQKVPIVPAGEKIQPQVKTVQSIEKRLFSLELWCCRKCRRFTEGDNQERETCKMLMVIGKSPPRTNV